MPGNKQELTIRSWCGQDVQDGQDGQDGQGGQDGEDGEDGHICREHTLLPDPSSIVWLFDLCLGQDGRSYLQSIITFYFLTLWLFDQSKPPPYLTSLTSSPVVFNIGLSRLREVATISGLITQTAAS